MYTYSKKSLESDTWVNIQQSSGQHCDIMNRNLCCTRLSSMAFRYKMEQRRGGGVQIRRRDKWMGRQADWWRQRDCSLWFNKSKGGMERWKEWTVACMHLSKMPYLTEMNGHLDVTEVNGFLWDLQKQSSMLKMLFSLDELWHTRNGVDRCSSSSSTQLFLCFLYWLS